MELFSESSRLGHGSALPLPEDEGSIQTLSTLGLLRRGVASRDAAERRAFPGALVRVAVDRSQLTRAIEPRRRAAVRPHDLAPSIASGPPLGVEHRGRELNRIEGACYMGESILVPPKSGSAPT
jgi:hypothetical protein